MRQSTKERCRIRHGYDALDLVDEGGQLIGEALGKNDWNDYDPHDPVDGAYMDLIMECAGIGHELVEQRDPERVRKWIIPKRDILLAEVKRRGLEQSPDAQFGFRKLEAVLTWLKTWEAPE
jgi:hypothetical protein